MMKFKILFLACIVVTASAWSYINYIKYWMKPAVDAPTIRVEVKEGETVAQLAQELKDKGIIRSSWFFKRYLASDNLDKKLQIASFDFKPGMNIKSVALALNDPHVATVKLLFKEGENVKDYGDVVEKSGLAVGSQFEEIVGYPAINYCINKSLPRPIDFSADYDFLKDKPQCIGLEGYLFPDTYYFGKDANVEIVARKMLNNFNSKLTPELRAEITRQKKTIHEIVTMSSLIEAEARDDQDRRMVSDVLWRRYSVGMGLELDSTVNYLTGKNMPAVTLDDTEINSLYNTYKYRGLPPGPINNPSLSAILAAIYPSANDNWFFLADKTGKVHFAKTLEEHVQLKYKYLK